MRILVDIGHPAHVHYFKNFTKSVIAHSAEVLFTCRDKDVTITLLKHYGFRYINFGRNYKSKPGKIFGLFYFSLKLFFVSLKFRPNIFLNSSMYSAIVAWLFRKTHVSLEDTFNKEQVNLYLPFTTCVLTGDYEHPSLGKKEIQYSGYQELLYLHPNNFKPDPGIFKELGIEYGASYVIIRFVSWNASHDVGHSGLTLEMKRKAVKELSEYAKVFISSEVELPEDLKKYQIKIPPEKMHDALAFATLFVGEGATMASECAMLGTPAIYVNSLELGYCEEEEKKYNLIYNFRNSEGILKKATELLNAQNLKQEFQKRRQIMLKDKIDVTAFMVWFIENYPESAKIMKENPNYQLRFK